jgi:hypothetical protein
MAGPGGLAAQSGGQRADVVGDEAVHRRHLARLGGVVGRGDLLAELNRLASLSMPYSWVLVCGYSSPVSGLGAVHVGGHRVGHHLAVGAVLGPLRDRVGEVHAEHALERLAVPYRRRSTLSSDRFSGP